MRTLLLALAAAALALLPAGAPAQSYPVKPIRIVTPYAPGGTAGILSQIVAQKLSEAWGHQVLVDHRPGASGMIGAEVAARAAPDGYTLLMAYVAEIAITKSQGDRDSAVMISNVMPSEKYSCPGSPDMFSNASTAIEGLSGRCGRGLLSVLSVLPPVSKYLCRSSFDETSSLR